MLTRSIGKVFRGKATPFQIIAACVLGGAIGFMPSFGTSAGLTVTLLLVLVILNANLAVAGLVGIVAKLLGLALVPVSYEFGRVLLDGPTGGLFTSMINAPVFALFGFEHYATAGGFVLGIVFGVISGVALVLLVQGFRRKMASLEEGSERYKQYASKWWVKALVFVFVGGGHGKKSYAELTQKRVGNPIRPIGVVLAALFIGLVIVAQQFLAGPIVTWAAQKALEKANGATVDLDRASVDLAAGSMTFEGLALADASNLSEDLLRATRVEAAISARDLLRKRFAFDTITVVDGLSGAQRTIPGRRIGRWPEPAPAPAESPKTIDDYVQDAQKWKDRLAQAKRWMERASGPAGDPSAESKETLEERLRRRVKELGYARVKATHLIEGSPTLLIREIVADGVVVEDLQGMVLDVRAENISTQPWIAGPPRTRIASRDGNLLVSLGLSDGASAEPAEGTPVRVVLKGISGDEVGRALKFVGEPPVRGGTVDIDAQGTTRAGIIDLPVSVTVRDATLTLPGVGSEHVALFTLPFSLMGPLDNPGVYLSDQALADALVKAGADRLAGEARTRANEAIDKATGKVTDKLGEKLGEELGGDAGKGLQDAAKGALDNLLGGGKKKEEPKKEAPKPDGD
jgi:uncharacterized protein (TIGR03546 family)